MIDHLIGFLGSYAPPMHFTSWGFVGIGDREASLDNIERGGYRNPLGVVALLTMPKARQAAASWVGAPPTPSAMPLSILFTK